MALLPSLFSPAEPPLRLAIIGGRLEDDNRAIYREMRRLSEGRVLIFPTASSDPAEVGEETRAAFVQHGFDVDVAPLHAANAQDAAFDPALVAQVEAFKSFYFTGGDQALIFQSMIQSGAETPVLKAVRAALKHGGMLAGSSAGAAMMSSPMILGGTSFEAMAHGVTDDPAQPGILLGEGLGFFPHGLVDQHFIKRGRLARLVVAMAHAGVPRGFGVDENTALIVDGAQARVCGEYGVFFVDMSKAKVDETRHSYDDIRLTYLDDGDGIDLRTFKSKPGEAKRRVRKSEIAYRAPAHSIRNAFGAYALYDLVARIVLSDQGAYHADTLMSNDPRSGVSAQVEVSRVRGASRCLIATPDEGLRITAVNLRASLKSERLAALPALDTQSRASVRMAGLNVSEASRIILLGSSPIFIDASVQKELVSLFEGPVGIFAAASAEARSAADDHIGFFRKHGVEAIDLGVTIDTVDYAAKDPNALARIAAMKSIFLCGGNQIRLVETLLHRGEESAVLHAIAEAYAKGAALIASGGATSALSGVMIAGGTTSEALRFGVSGHDGSQGLLIHEGIGLFAPGIADQNMISAKRLGRLVVACVENNERFGIGVCEESAAIAGKAGLELQAAGRHGFILVETDPVKSAPVGDRFIARDIRLRMFGPGDRINLASGAVERNSVFAAAAKAAFDRMLSDLMRDCGELGDAERSGRDPSARHAIKLRIQRNDNLSAVLDLECAREEHDDG
jgi:cyanophycinase